MTYHAVTRPHYNAAHFEVVGPAAGGVHGVEAGDGAVRDGGDLISST
jgi:hypothetical protein